MFVRVHAGEIKRKLATSNGWKIIKKKIVYFVSFERIKRLVVSSFPYFKYINQKAILKGRTQSQFSLRLLI